MTALMFVATTMMAVPAKPGLKKKVTLKDGTTVELSLKGDEHFSYYTDAAGKPCKLKNGELIKLTRFLQQKSPQGGRTRHDYRKSKGLGNSVAVSGCEILKRQFNHEPNLQALL